MRVGGDPGAKTTRRPSAARVTTARKAGFSGGQGGSPRAQASRYAGVASAGSGR